MRKYPSKTLLRKMLAVIDTMENVLRDDGLTAETQIADVQSGCWAMIELTFRLQQSVFDELSDLE